MIRPKIQFSNFNCVGESLEEVKSESNGLYVLLGCCEEYLNEVQDNKNTDSDLPHYIYEYTLEYIYGKNVWDWISQDHNKEKENYELYLKLKERFEK
jgi:hypothetical protein